ncbi:putative Lipocalin-like domain-containing protein [Tenacibaculum sp. 190130A14a]|uniref:Lipocalin-like domain-containing protein n=1 Tax=Tenacibaculum polynesiense TaxID=3137857 RepID=A0ABP1F4B4_9FLAO
MKKIILVLTTLILVSCSSSNNTITIKEDIIGEWHLVEFILNDKSVTTTCQKKSTINFKPNGSFVSETFDLNRGSCQSSGDKNGTWNTESVNRYSLKFNDGEMRIAISSTMDGNRLIINRTIDDFKLISVFTKKD